MKYRVGGGLLKDEMEGGEEESGLVGKPGNKNTNVQF